MAVGKFKSFSSPSSEAGRLNNRWPAFSSFSGREIMDAVLRIAAAIGCGLVAGLIDWRLIDTDGAVKGRNGKDESSTGTTRN